MAATLGNTEALLLVGPWKTVMVVLMLPAAKPSLFLVITSLLSNPVVGP